MTPKKRIYFDVTAITDFPYTDGIRRVILSWLHALSTSDQSVELQIIPVIWHGNNFKVSFKWARDRSFSLSPAGLDGLEWKPAKSDVLFVPSYALFQRYSTVDWIRVASQVRVVSVLYDLLPVTNPEWFPNEVGFDFRNAFKNQITFSSDVIVNSNHVKNELIRLHSEEFKIPNLPNIWVVPLSGDNLKTKFAVVSSEKKNNWKSREISRINRVLDRNRNKKILLMVGTIEPRKAHLQIINYLSKSKLNEEIFLVIVGRLGWKSSDFLAIIKKRSTKKFSIWFDNLSDEGIVHLYKKSNLYLAASFDEGFGLPLLEARANDLIICARDIPVFREVAPSNTVFFEIDNLENALIYALDHSNEIFAEGVTCLNSVEDQVGKLLKIL
ncbi:MAG: mannosyltransferase [Actinomycetota bacterium]|jgi:hypothetical protein